MDNEIKSFAKFLYSIPPTEFSLLSSVLGVLICKKLVPKEHQTVGNFLEAVGQTILTYYSQYVLLNPTK